MAALYIYSFLAGLFAANGVPHFVKGIAGAHSTKHHLVDHLQLWSMLSGDGLILW